MIAPLSRALFNSIVYPIMGIFANLFFATLVTLALIGNIVFAPILLFLHFNKQDTASASVLKAIGFTIPMILACIFLIPLSLAYYFVIDLLKLSIYGAILGFDQTSSIQCFYKAWRVGLSDYFIYLTHEFFGKTDRRSADYISWDSSSSDSDEEVEKQPVITDHDFDKYNIKAPIKPTSLVLSDNELATAVATLKQIIDSNSKLKTNLSKHLDHYQNLRNRLMMLNDAKKTNAEFDDELMSYTPIKNPIIFQKVYEKEDTINNESIKKTKVIPASTYISDRENIKEWFESKGTHPYTRDMISHPDKFEKTNKAGEKKTYPTRYQWYFYAGQSQELYETARKIRKLCTKAKDLVAQNSRDFSESNQSKSMVL